MYSLRWPSSHISLGLSSATATTNERWIQEPPSRSASLQSRRPRSLRRYSRQCEPTAQVKTPIPTDCTVQMKVLEVISTHQYHRPRMLHRSRRHVQKRECAARLAKRRAFSSAVGASVGLTYLCCLCVAGVARVTERRRSTIASSMFPTYLKPFGSFLLTSTRFRWAWLYFTENLWKKKQE